MTKVEFVLLLLAIFASVAFFGTQAGMSVNQDVLTPPQVTSDLNVFNFLSTVGNYIGYYANVAKFTVAGLPLWMNLGFGVLLGGLVTVVILIVRGN